MSKRAISVDETKSSAFLKQQQEAATKPDVKGKARAMSLDTGNTNQERSISAEIVGEIKDIFFKMPAFEVSQLLILFFIMKYIYSIFVIENYNNNKHNN
jgi:hypothetical protein